MHRRIAGQGGALTARFLGCRLYKFASTPRRRRQKLNHLVLIVGEPSLAMWLSLPSTASSRTLIVYVPDASGGVGLLTIICDSNLILFHVGDCERRRWLS